jgi:hypothetical protein
MSRSWPRTSCLLSAGAPPLKTLSELPALSPARLRSKEQQPNIVSLRYVGLEPRTLMEPFKIDKAFVAARTNGLIQDLRSAARVIITILPLMTKYGRKDRLSSDDENPSILGVNTPSLWVHYLSSRCRRF